MSGHALLEEQASQLGHHHSVAVEGRHAVVRCEGGGRSERCRLPSSRRLTGWVLQSAKAMQKTTRRVAVDASNWDTRRRSMVQAVLNQQVGDNLQGILVQTPILVQTSVFCRDVDRSLIG